MKEQKFPIRFEIRLSNEHAKIVKEIAKKLRTTDSEAIRICICDYWEKI